MQIVILAGGRSSRFGSDKALHVSGGSTLLERVTDAALATGLRILVVGREMPENWSRETLRFITDEQPGFGPLGGLVTALRVAGDEVLLCACDMPGLSSRAFQWLMEIKPQAAEKGIVTVNGGQVEPLFARYTLDCLETAETLMQTGSASMRALIDAGSFMHADAPEWLRPQLLNVNKPDDLVRENRRAI